MLLFLAVGMVSVFTVITSSDTTNRAEAPVVTQPTEEGLPNESQGTAFREIKLPEATRKRIYEDYRAVARTTIEKPLPLPQGSPARPALEQMLQKALDRELNRFAALHNISLDDVHEVILEGDAKSWDPSPRSHATRNGKRLYSEEMSEGWKPSTNIR